MKPNYSFFSLFILWFGAAISIAEIMTAGMIAEAGQFWGISAIISAHLLACIIMALMGVIGFQTKKPSLMCSRRSFGIQGSWILSLANIIQLVGWTAVMLQQGGQALASILEKTVPASLTFYCIILLGALVALWSWWEAVDKKKANIVAVSLLFVLCLILSYLLISESNEVKKQSNMDFGLAFELAFIMPLSWIMLVADYSCKADKLKTASLAPALGYFIASVWMYLIGFFGVLIFNESNPVTLLLTVGLGFVALGIVTLSALTTTFLDVYSAAVSALNILPNLSKRVATLVIVVTGTLMAVIWDSNLYMSLLSFIGAIFAPLSAIICYDYFICKVDYQNQKYNWQAFVSLIIGIILYYSFSNFSLILGSSLSCLIATFVVHHFVRKSSYYFSKN